MISSKLGIKLAIWTIASFYGWFAFVALVQDTKQPVRYYPVSSVHSVEAIEDEHEEAEETGLALTRDDLAVLYLSDDEAMIDVAMCTQSGLDFSMCYGLYGED